VHVEAFGLKAGEAVGDGLKALAYGTKILQAFVDAKIFLYVVGAKFVVQEGGKLFVWLEEGVFELGPEYVVAMIDALEGGVELAVQPFGHARAEDFGDFLTGRAPEADFAGALEDFADREVSLEDEVAAVFDPGQEVRSAQVHGDALPPGELGAEHEGSVLQSIANDLRAEAIGGGL